MFSKRDDILLAVPSERKTEGYNRDAAIELAFLVLEQKLRNAASRILDHIGEYIERQYLTLGVRESLWDAVSHRRAFCVSRV